MLQGASQDLSKDFHIPVRMHAKAHPWRYPVIVDDSQAAEPHPTRVVIISETERVEGVQPTVVRVPALMPPADRHHATEGDRAPRDRQSTSPWNGHSGGIVRLE